MGRDDGPDRGAAGGIVAGVAQTLGDGVCRDRGVDDLAEAGGDVGGGCAACAPIGVGYHNVGTGWSTGRKPVATGGRIDVGNHNVGTGFLPVLPSRD